MIYVVENSSINENVVDISPMDAMMDILEATIEYNENSYLYEGVGGGAKEMIKGLIKKFTGLIDSIIAKIKELIFSQQVKSLEKRASKGQKVILKGEGLKYKQFKKGAIDSHFIDGIASEINSGSKELKDAKEEFNTKFKSEDSYVDVPWEESFNPAQKIKEIRKDANDFISDLKAAKALASKNMTDANNASKAISFWSYAVSKTSNKAMQLYSVAFRKVSRAMGKPKDVEGKAEEAPKEEA